MTDEQMIVFHSLSQGRLMFPFEDEIEALEESAAAGGLTSDESRQLEQLLSLEEQFLVHDDAFGAAMKSGNIVAAEAAARQALAVLEKAR